jgi:hypothetical protein
MQLINTTDYPPQGYQYYEPSIDWRAPRELALQGLPYVAKALQTVRAQNPAAGLDPSYEACVRAIGEYTCARLAPWPDKLAHYCGGEPVTEQERQAVAAAQRVASATRGCASCGGRRR